MRIPLDCALPGSLNLPSDSAYELQQSELHFDLTSTALRFHFDFTFDSLRFQFDFTSVSLRFDFEPQQEKGKPLLTTKGKGNTQKGIREKGKG